MNQPTTTSGTAASVAVVGAGPGGLATACMLASAGFDVTVYERQPEIGGRTGRLVSETDRGAFWFDKGPTFFLMPYVLEEIFSSCGRRLSDYCELTRLDPMYRLIIGRPEGDPVTIDTTQDVQEMARRIGEIDAGDGRAFERFIADNRAKLDASEPILRRPVNSLFDLVRTDAVKAAPHIKPHMSVHQLLGKYFKHPASKLAVSFQSKYLGMSPFDCPSLFTILPFIEYEYGVWHPKGGCHAVMEALRDLLLDLGGRVECGAVVEGLAFEQKKVTGVVINGEARPCDQVVLNADAPWALKKLVPSELRPGAWSDEAIDRKKYSCSTYMLYLGVEGTPDELNANLPHHTIYTSTAYEQNLDDIGRDKGFGGSLSTDPSFYVCNPSRVDPGMSPDGCSALYVLLPCPNGRADIDWKTESPKVRETLLDQMRDRMGLDVRGRIITETAYTPDTWAGMGINLGATFNLAHSLDQMLHKRVPHRLPTADGVWFVGGGTHPGSGLPVIFLSAQIAAREMARRHGMQDPTLPVRTSARQEPRESAREPALV